MKVKISDGWFPLGFEIELLKAKTHHGKQSIGVCLEAVRRLLRKNKIKLPAPDEYVIVDLTATLIKRGPR